MLTFWWFCCHFISQHSSPSKTCQSCLYFTKNVLTSTSQLPSFLSSKKLQGKAQTLTLYLYWILFDCNLLFKSLHSPSPSQADGPDGLRSRKAYNGGVSYWLTKPSYGKILRNKSWKLHYVRPFFWHRLYLFIFNADSALVSLTISDYVNYGIWQKKKKKAYLSSLIVTYDEKILKVSIRTKKKKFTHSKNNFVHFNISKIDFTLQT